jgi:tetratricopeptide (TPR) repeat protein
VDEGPVRRAADDAVARGRAPTRRGAAPGAGNGRGPAEPTGRAGRAGRDGNTASRGSDAGRRRPGRDATRRRRASARAEQALELDRDRLVRQLGVARADRSIQRLGEAADAFAHQRYEEARRLLRPLARSISAEPAIRELHGQTLYRLGRWRPAIAELEAFAELTGSVEQHPVLADCHRALGHHDRVAELWEELGEASPAAYLVAEGRIVLAGSLADQGRLADAIATLEAGSLGSGKLKDHHLRMRYFLGDLYDRAGEHQAARRHFDAVASVDPDFYDVTDRLRQL